MTVHSALRIVHGWLVDGQPADMSTVSAASMIARELGITDKEDSRS